MRIKVENAEFDFLPEDLRHFNLNNAKDVANFINTLKKDKALGPLGFKTNSKTNKV